MLKVPVINLVTIMISNFYVCLAVVDCRLDDQWRIWFNHDDSCNEGTWIIASLDLSHFHLEKVFETFPPGKSFDVIDLNCDITSSAGHSTLAMSTANRLNGKSEQTLQTVVQCLFLNKEQI